MDDSSVRSSDPLASVRPRHTVQVWWTRVSGIIRANSFVTPVTSATRSTRLTSRSSSRPVPEWTRAIIVPARVSTTPGERSAMSCWAIVPRTSP